jgi:hypothetical protein
MANYHKKKRGIGGFLRGLANGKNVTYNLTSKGDSEILKAGVTDGHAVPGALLSKLFQTGEIYTRRTWRPSTKAVDGKSDYQLELPFGVE